MNKLPRLEHTNNDKLYTYTVYRIPNSLHEYVLKRHLLLAGPIFDHSFDFRFNDFEAIHKQILDQGFVPFLPGKEDAPNIVITYM